MTAPEYDKTRDPNRVAENIVRAEIAALNAAGKFPDGFHLVQQGSFSPGGDGCYAAVRCVTLHDDAPDQDKPFCLHDVVLQAEQAGVLGVLLINGEYDLSVEDAAARL